MPLFEYFCTPCRKKFEQISSAGDPEAGRCPLCQGKQTQKLISRFAIGGQGDLRESTMHGCHDYDGAPGQEHSHGPGDDHSHNHGEDHGHDDSD
jgi:putative FmdB family regulatory protein